MKECKLCKKECDDLNHEIELFVLEMIKKENPQWVEPDGACEACIKYYESLDNVVVVRE